MGVVMLGLADMVWSVCLLGIGIFSQGAAAFYALQAPFYFGTGLGLVFFNQWARKALLKYVIPLSISVAVVTFVQMASGLVPDYLSMSFGVQLGFILFALAIPCAINLFYLELPQVSARFLRPPR